MPSSLFRKIISQRRRSTASRRQGCRRSTKIGEARRGGPSGSVSSSQVLCCSVYRLGGGVVPGVVFWGTVGGVVLGGFVVPGAGVLVPGGVCGVMLPGSVSGVGVVGGVSGVGVSGVVAVPGVGVAVPGVGVAVPGVGAAVPGVGAAVPRVGAAVPGVGAAVPGVCVCGVEPGCDVLGVGTAV